MQFLKNQKKKKDFFKAAEFFLAGNESAMIRRWRKNTPGR
jgi:hypothetical protein